MSGLSLGHMEQWLSICRMYSAEYRQYPILLPGLVHRGIFVSQANKQDSTHLLVVHIDVTPALFMMST